MKISVAICTYNRSDLLAHCLQSLTEQSVPSADFEVVVIDNNSRDNTQEVALSFSSQFEHLKVVKETQQGLSFARNRAIQEAGSDWVLYLDDDAKADEVMVQKAMETIENTDFKIFGGLFLPWYYYGKPPWYKDRYATNRLSYTTTSPIKEGEYVCGGIFCVHKSLFAEYGQFNTGIGMRGDVVGYGEETEFQNILKKDKIPIGYIPDLIIYHIVKADRLSVESFFQSNFAVGRDKVVAGSAPTNWPYLVSVLLTAIVLTLVDAIKNGIKLLTQKDYFIENWLIDSFRKTAKRLGILYTALIQKYGHSA